MSSGPEHWNKQTKLWEEYSSAPTKKKKKKYLSQFLQFIYREDSEAHQICLIQKHGFDLFMAFQACRVLTERFDWFVSAWTAMDGSNLQHEGEKANFQRGDKFINSKALWGKCSPCCSLFDLKSHTFQTNTVLMIWDGVCAGWALLLWEHGENTCRFVAVYSFCTIFMSIIEYTHKKKDVMEL